MGGSRGCSEEGPPGVLPPWVLACPSPFLTTVCSCVQDPEGPAGLSCGPSAAMQHKTPPEGLCGTHTLSAQSDAKDAHLNPDPGSQSCQGPGRVALSAPPPHPPLLASADSVLPAPPPARAQPASPRPASGPAPFPAQPPRVEVRMIDFAHSTFKGFRGDTAVHDGPDRGYVFGLESLVQILESLRDDNPL